MARKYYWQNIIDNNGEIVKGAYISVYLSGTNTYTYFATTEEGNVTTSERTDIITNSSGFFSFWILDVSDSATYGYEPNQRFRIKIYKEGIIDRQIDDVEIFDSSDINSLRTTKNLSDVENASAARTNLGLGTASILNYGTEIGETVVLESVDGTPGLPIVDGSQLTGIIGTGGKPKFLNFVNNDIDIITTGTPDASKGTWVDNAYGITYYDSIRLGLVGGSGNSAYIVFDIQIDDEIFDLGSNISLTALLFFDGIPVTEGDTQQYLISTDVVHIDTGDRIDNNIKTTLDPCVINLINDDFVSGSGSSYRTAVEEITIGTLIPSEYGVWTRFSLSKSEGQGPYSDYLDGTCRFLGFRLKQA